jgi:enoyl-CoA hydratase/carnithine racemase
MKSPHKPLLFEKQGPVAIITFNRPEKYNAMNGVVYDLLEKVVKTYVSDNSLLCAIITGAGGNFSSGGDLKWFQEWHDAHEPDESYDFPAYKALQQCPKPIIAAIDGYCLASGFNCAVLYCDIRIASERAKMGIPAIKQGLNLPYSIPLPWYMTLGNSLYIVLTGKQLSAEEAFHFGIVSEVVNHERLMDRAMELANTIAEGAPMHVRIHKQFLRRFVEVPGFGQQLIDMITEPMHAAQDTAEGRKAFIEKRKPVYKNK